MELIDRRRLVSDFWKGVEDCSILSYEDTDDLMENAPTVDAVEVVRCKNCKISFYNPLFSDDGSQLICRKRANNHIVNEDGYCSYGERCNNE